MSLSRENIVCVIGMVVLIGVAVVCFTMQGEGFSAFVQTPGQVKSERFSKSARDNIYVRHKNEPLTDYYKNVDTEFSHGNFTTTYSPSAAPTGKSNDRTAMDAMRLSEIDNDLDLNIARVHRAENLGKTGILAY